MRTNRGTPSACTSYVALRPSPTAQQPSKISTLRPSSTTAPGIVPYIPRTRRWALLAVVVVSFATAAWVAHPLWVSLLLGVVMAVSAQRPYEWLLGKLGQKRSSWAAALVTLTLGALFAACSAAIVLVLANEMMKVVSHLNQHGNADNLQGLVGDSGARLIHDIGFDTQHVFDWIRKQIESAAAYFGALAALVVRTTSYAVLGLIVALLTMYYMLVDGHSLARRIERIAPLEPRHTRALLQEARDVGRDAFVGTLLTAVIQGLIAGVGYAALGVPQPVTWAVATGLASFLPVVGTLLVWVPLSGYLAMEGHPVRGILLAVWGFLVITSLADYVIRPRIVGRGNHGHPLLTLIALLGGIEVFGLAGLIVAPIVMSVFVAAFRIYERDVRTGDLPQPGADEEPVTTSATAPNG